MYLVTMLSRFSNNSRIRRFRICTCGRRLVGFVPFLEGFRVIFPIQLMIFPYLLSCRPTAPTRAPSFYIQMGSAALPVTTGTSPKYIGKMTALASRAFVTDGFPFIVLRERYNLNHLTRDDLARHYGDRIELKIKQGATIIEAGNWAAAAVWQPPVFTNVDVKPTSKEEYDSPTLADFSCRSDAARKKHLGVNVPYWYLSLMAREPGNTTKGAVRAVLEPFISKAKAEGLPIWLEAGIERARDVYKYFGFRVVDMIVSGRGLYNVEGEPQEGGEGVPTWLMMLDAPE